MQLFCRLISPPTLTAHPKKKMSLLVKHSVHVDKTIWKYSGCDTVSPPPPPWKIVATPLLLDILYSLISVQFVVLFLVSSMGFSQAIRFFDTLIKFVSIVI